MKTTLELPDSLFREIKATAALNGMKIKDFVAEALMEKLKSTSASPLQKPWMRGFGALADLREETRSIVADIEETFGQIDEEHRS